MKSAPKRQSKQRRARSSRTGRFVSIAEAQADPDRTQVEAIERADKEDAAKERGNRMTSHGRQHELTSIAVTNNSHPTHVDGEDDYAHGDEIRVVATGMPNGGNYLHTVEYINPYDVFSYTGHGDLDVTFRIGHGVPWTPQLSADGVNPLPNTTLNMRADKDANEANGYLAAVNLLVGPPR